MSDAELASLPVGVFAEPGGGRRVGMRYGDQVIDLAAVLGDPVFSEPALNQFFALGPSAWTDAGQRVREIICRTGGGSQPAFFPVSAVEMYLPVHVADFVDFYSSLEHATNASRIFRPGQPPLKPNWRELPAGYHGRAGTVVVSGTDVRRPRGQVAEDGQRPRLRPTSRLDCEVELGFVVGAGSPLGVSVPPGDFERHVFGVVLLLDWSARDIQAFESQPLGPFLGKSFATSISPWVVPLAALRDARASPPARTPEPLPYLRETTNWSLDIDLEFSINGNVVSRPNTASLYWTGAQQMAHMTINGASLRTGDLFGSGTVSSFEASAQGSLLELTHNGSAPLTLSDRSSRGYLEDGDLVTVTGHARLGSGGRLDLGAVTGRVLAALSDLR